MKIADIKIGKRHRKSLGDIDSLAASIASVGLLHPPVVTSADVLVCGERRVKACEKLGWDDIDVRVIDCDSLLQAEHDENELRDEFTASERVAIARELQREIGSRQGERVDKSTTSGQLPGSSPGTETRDHAAKSAGFKSTDEFRRAAKVVDKGVPELVEAMDKKEVSASAAAEVADLPKEEQKAAVRGGTVKAKASATRKGKAKGKPAETPKPTAPGVIVITEEDEKEERAKREAAIHKDAHGNVIPPNLRDTFLDPELNETILDLERILDDLDARYQLISKSLSHKPYIYCHFQRALGTLVEIVNPKSGTLRQTIEYLSSGIPHIVCACKGKNKKCERCRGGGCLPQWRFDELAELERAGVA